MIDAVMKNSEINNIVILMQFVSDMNNSIIQCPTMKHVEYIVVIDKQNELKEVENMYGYKNEALNALNYKQKIHLIAFEFQISSLLIFHMREGEGC